ncbi:hypothetical protein ACLOJK_035474 [Asimina triloba]
MAFLWFSYLLMLFSFSPPISNSFQYSSYDSSSCSSDQLPSGSRYACHNSSTPSCQTFIIYRSQPGFQTISDISQLLQFPNQSQLIQINNLTTASQVLDVGRDVLVPINCSCSDEFFQSHLTYTVPEPTTYSEIACGVFESMLKTRVLFLENPNSGEDVPLPAGAKLHVPLKCACSDATDGVRYLVTYPFVSGDGPALVARKFGIPVQELWAANGFKDRPTVYPNTTFLVPLKHFPVINHSADARNPPPVFVPLVPIKATESGFDRVKLCLAIAAAAILLVILVSLAVGFYFKYIRIMISNKKLKTVVKGSPAASPLSPDLVVGMSNLKYSLCNYTIQELREATKNFSEENRLSGSTHKGKMGDFQVIVKEVSFGDSHRIIGIYSKINHTNIVRLHGMCFGRGDCSRYYLVFEYAGDQCLRNCLESTQNTLQWQKRTQIAYDVAIGLHYLHYCSVPSYVHMNISSRTILITWDGRAKIANFGVASTAVCFNGKRDDPVAASMVGWIAPEYLLEGTVSEKVDVFAFGVVLFELTSGREWGDGCALNESLGFLGGRGSEGSCFQRLRGFMDPGLKDDYPLGDALCMAVLAKACVEDDPLHRPSMNDVLKVLARMV